MCTTSTTQCTLQGRTAGVRNFFLSAQRHFAAVASVAVSAAYLHRHTNSSSAMFHCSLYIPSSRATRYAETDPKLAVLPPRQSACGSGRGASQWSHHEAPALRRLAAPTGCGSAVSSSTPTNGAAQAMVSCNTLSTAEAVAPVVRPPCSRSSLHACPTPPHGARQGTASTQLQQHQTAAAAATTNRQNSLALCFAFLGLDYSPARRDRRLAARSGELQTAPRRLPPCHSPGRRRVQERLLTLRCGWRTPAGHREMRAPATPSQVVSDRRSLGRTGRPRPRRHPGRGRIRTARTQTHAPTPKPEPRDARA